MQTYRSRGRETSDNAALTVGAMDAACHANTLGRAVANENTTNGPATLKKATRLPSEEK